MRRSLYCYINLKKLVEYVERSSEWMWTIPGKILYVKCDIKKAEDDWKRLAHYRGQWKNVQGRQRKRDGFHKDLEGFAKLNKFQNKIG